MKVLVTGASIVYALPVIRRLGRLGHEVTVADSNRRASGFYSRYTAARWLHPPLSGGGDHFGAALREYLMANPHHRIVPLFEETIPIARAQDLWPELVRAQVGRYRSLMQFHDKAALYRFAERIGVLVPRTIEWTGAAPAGFVFPAMLKVPQSSCGRGVLRVRAAAEVPEALQRLAQDHALPAHVRTLLQEEVEAESISAFGFAWEGRPKGLIVYRSLGLYPRRGGSGVIRQSLRHPEVERQALLLMTESRWHGPVGFDFMALRGTGRAFLIDGNPRLTPAVVLAARCGFDAVKMMTDEREPADAGVVPAGQSNVTEPMAVSWLLECLKAGPEGWREALRLIGPILRARADVLDARDLRSLLAGPAALIEMLRAARSPVPVGLEMIRHGQYSDYDSRLEDRTG